MDDVLKSNFKVKNPVVVETKAADRMSIKETLKKKALSSLGGSMVYVERTGLHWDGELQPPQTTAQTPKAGQSE